MGANQSSDTGAANGAGAGTTSGERSTCYYELLGVEKRATDEEYVRSRISRTAGQLIWNCALGSRKHIARKPSSSIQIVTMGTLRRQRRFLPKYRRRMKFCLIPRNEHGTIRIGTPCCATEQT